MAAKADGVVLHPVVYQFCANWDETKREVPPQFDEINKFCGMRLMFQSDTREQLRKLPADYVTNYDRMLEKLLDEVRQARQLRAARPGASSKRSRANRRMQADRKFSIWRWCPARDRGLHTACTASVVLSIDPATGSGHGALFDAAALGIRVRAREERLQGRPALQDAARPEVASRFSARAGT